MRTGVQEDHVSAAAFELAGFARPHAGDDVCGDVFAWKIADGTLTLLVADGIGHGSLAREAASRAADCVLRDDDRALERIMRRCHDALVRTRGAAVAIVRLEMATGLLAFCGVGNIGLREFPRRGGRGTSFPGVVGLRMPSVRVFESRVTQGDVILLHSDGIEDSIDLGRIKDLTPRDSVRALEAWHGKPNDDATVVVLRFQEGGAA